MGNQNKIQQSTKSIQEKEPCYIIDLDEIVEEWIWYKWKKTKSSKSSSRFKRDDLLIKINWKHVSFIQKGVNYHHSSFSCYPRTIFRTNFDNKTMTEHSYTFQTEQVTTSTFKYIFNRTLYTSYESNLIFQLPEQILKNNNGMKREQLIPLRQNVTKEHEKVWNVNSEIHVPYQTRINAELNIDEEEFHSRFSLCIKFSGYITANIVTRQSPSVHLKSIHGDIVRIMTQAMKINPQLNSFQIVRGKSPSVYFTAYGKCVFRYGVKQNIVLNQESLNLVLLPDFNNASAPVKYSH